VFAKQGSTTTGTADIKYSNAHTMS